MVTPHESLSRLILRHGVPERETDRQTDRQTETERDKERDRETERDRERAGGDLCVKANFPNKVLFFVCKKPITR